MAGLYDLPSKYTNRPLNPVLDFRVKDPLPNITFPLEHSFAGNLPVQRAGHPNNTLFFVGFEKSEGSLTAPPNDTSSPWGIWLNGGCVPDEPRGDPC